MTSRIILSSNSPSVIDQSNLLPGLAIRLVDDTWNIKKGLSLILMTLGALTLLVILYFLNMSCIKIQSMNMLLIFIRPTCRDVLWYGVGVCLSVRLTVRLCVCESVHKACKHNTDWTVWAGTVKLWTHTSYNKRTTPTCIHFQGQGSKVNATCLTLFNFVKPRHGTIKGGR